MWALSPAESIHAAPLPDTSALPSNTPPMSIVKRDRGRVVRLVHHTIEGEPFEGQEPPRTLVQVLFDGHTQVLAFDPRCLRRVEP